MTLVRRYLYELGLHLPSETKDDILKEVESIIYDMLGDDLSERHVEEVLLKLGDPKKLSHEYRGKKRYLIGPEYFDLYLKVVFMVALIFGFIHFVVSLVDQAIVGFESEELIISSISFVFVALGSFISGALSGATIVTIVFAIIDYKDIEIKTNHTIGKRTAWTPAKLKELPKASLVPYKKSSIIGDIIATAIFTSLFLLLAKYLGWYDKNGMVVQLFNMDRFHAYAIAIIILTGFEIVTQSIKLIIKYPNYKYATITSIRAIADSIVKIAFLLDPVIIQTPFKEKVASFFQTSLANVNSVWDVVVRVFVAIIVIGTLIEIIVEFYKAHQNEKVS